MQTSSLNPKQGALGTNYHASFLTTKQGVLNTTQVNDIGLAVEERGQVIGDVPPTQRCAQNDSIDHVQL